MQGLDTTLGEKVVGHDKTISAHVQEKLVQATQQARAVDEQKGYSKQASDVRPPFHPRTSCALI